MNWLFLGALVCCVSGCWFESQDREAASPLPISAEQTTGGDVAETNITPPSAELAEPAVEAGEPEPVAAPVSGTPGNAVTLGDPALTAGIPGSGPLTVDQIKSWINDPVSHATLQVTLPSNLVAGSGGIKIPADNPLTRAKIELGRQLYFDRRLSANGSVSCADCHHPDEGYARNTQFGVGIGEQTGNRNSPVSYNRILSDAQFWDGRAGSLEEQAIGPIANPIEMGNTHEVCVKTVKEIEGYRIQFEKIFPDGVTIANIGRAIASFERTIVTGPAPFDYYEPLRAFKTAYAQDLADLDSLKEEDPDLYETYTSLLKASQEHPMSESAQRGREIFFGQRGGCSACHVGVNLTDEKYHNLGVGMDKEEPDLGRYAVTKQDQDRGAFKTPTIRNVELTAPYMHDGSQKTLEEVIEWYDKGGHPNPWLSKNIKKLGLTPQEKKDLVEFMKACTSETPQMETQRLP